MQEKTENISESQVSQAEMQSPSDAEFQVLAAIWQHKKPVSLNEICDTLKQRLAGTPALAPTTISTYLRRLESKGLVRLRSAGPPSTMRLGMLAPRRGRPGKAVYEPTCPPSQLMAATFDNLVQAYPADQRDKRPALDLFEVMKFPAEKVAALRCHVEHDGDAASLLIKLFKLLPDEAQRNRVRLFLHESDSVGT